MRLWDTSSRSLLNVIKRQKKKTERAEENIVWIPPPPPQKKTNSIVELRDLTERFLS